MSALAEQWAAAFAVTVAASLQRDDHPVPSGWSRTANPPVFSKSLLTPMYGSAFYDALIKLNGRDPHVEIIALKAGLLAERRQETLHHLYFTFLSCWMYRLADLINVGEGIGQARKLVRLTAKVVARRESTIPLHDKLQSVFEFTKENQSREIIRLVYVICSGNKLLPTLSTYRVTPAMVAAGVEALTEVLRHE